MEEKKQNDELDSFEREFEEDDDDKKDGKQDKKVEVEIINENQAEIDKLRAKRTKKWQYYRNLHAKSTTERMFVTNEKVFLE